MSRVGMFVKTEHDRVKLMHEAFELIYKTIYHSKKTNYIVLHVINNLNREEIYYNGRKKNFTEFVLAVLKDTKGKYSATIKTHNELKTILIKLMTAIRNVVIRKDDTKDVFEFIEMQHGFNISNKDSVNLLNFLINYDFFDTFNTNEFLKIMYPELAEKIVKRDIPDPPEILNAKLPPRPQPPSNSSRNKPRNAARNAPRNQTRNKPREQSKNKPKNATRKNQNGKKKERENAPKKEKPPAEFPFGAEKTD